MQLNISKKLSDTLCEIKAQSGSSFNKLIEEAIELIAYKYSITTKPLVEEKNEPDKRSTK